MDERRVICRQQQLDNIEELLQHIQSFLPLKEAARTCILSKTWLHAWSTVPHLRFPQSAWISTKQERNLNFYIDRTLIGYHHPHIPISSIYLDINIKYQNSAFLAQNWIRHVASKASELNLKIWTCVSSFTLTDKIFSGQNLRRICVRLETYPMISSLWISGDHVINCRSLQELELIGVNISEQVLENLLSNCTLLKKINLLFHEGLKNIKVKNLRFLEELKITSRGENDIVEIDNVPSLRLIYYDALFEQRRKPVPLKSGLLASVKELYLDGVHLESSFSKMIKSKFPFLENLTLNTRSWNPKSLDIASLSLKRLTLRLWDRGRFSLQVCAPKLTCFCYNGYTIQHYLFPDIAPKEVKLNLKVGGINQSFFLDLREMMINLPSEFDIKIIHESSFVYRIHVNIDLDDLRETTLFPATNVRKLSFSIACWAPRREHSQFFEVLEAFLTICHPGYIKLHQKMLLKENKLCKLMLLRMMEKKNTDVFGSDLLKEVEVKRGTWETILADSWMSVVDENSNSVRFKLNWST